MTPAEQIRAIRQSTGLSQAAFSVIYEIPKRTLENWESGVRTPPPYVITMLQLVVKAYKPEDLRLPEDDAQIKELEDHE